MTIKEAIIKSLDDIQQLANYTEIYDHIVKSKYYDFGSAKTPSATVSALLGNFIRDGDTRVKRIKGEGRTFLYYLAKNEDNIGTDVLTGITESRNVVSTKEDKSYKERDLHKLLSTFLKSHNIDSKTIFHEKSANKKDRHQKWIHPDMIGIAFLNLQNQASQALLKSVNRDDTFKLNSYEIKKEINSDYELKECFFQAVSNSSWANHGYLVAFDINESLRDEIKRLNQSFGIGVIELRANPFESKVLFPAKYKELDFKTIDKLCRINKDFENFIIQIEKTLNASEKYINDAERGLQEFCDDYLQGDSDVQKYCKEKNIPME